jgi:deoxyadenosine/deoxycytidine kinase
MASIYNYISVEGNIGAGKTTATNILVEAFNATAIYEEFNEIPFLPLFYKDPQRYAFPLEVSFLHARYEQLKNQVVDNMLVADYHLGKCLVFSENNLSAIEFDLYRKLYDVLSNNLMQPEILVYIDADVSLLKSRIAKRGRSYEQDIKAEYLLNITRRYKDFLKNIKSIPVLILNIKDKDMLTDAGFKDKFIAMFSKPYPCGITDISF